MALDLLGVLERGHINGRLPGKFGQPIVRQNRPTGRHQVALGLLKLVGQVVDHLLKLLDVRLNLSLLFFNGLKINSHRGIDVAGLRVNSSGGHRLFCGSKVSPSLAAICS